MNTDEPRGPVQGHAWRYWPLLAILAIVALLTMRKGDFGAREGEGVGAQPRAIQARGDLAADEQATIELFQRASPAVAFITTLTVRRDVLSFNLLESPQGTGSGFIWDNQGHVVTNFHVLQNADSARVTLSDQSTWDAKLVGAAPDKDLAVLKIDAEPSRLKALPVGESANLQVGQKVFAIGNPFGLDQTLTTGVISQVGREIKSVTGRLIKGVIQTDAAINPGNSGGPLLDSAGRLIGVNTAIYSPSGAYAGVGFAMPVNTVNTVVPQLIRHGKVVRPGFGITIFPDSQTQRHGLKGVLIREVLEGGAASRAGMRPTRYDARGRLRLGDLIVAIEGKAIADSEDLYSVLDGYKAGDTVNVRISRDGRESEVAVSLQALD